MQTATAGANAFGQSYAYDGGSRLGQRTLARNGTTLVQESLGYDSLARLTTVNGTPQFAYDALGNTRWQAGVGHYRYEAPLGGSALRPNAVSRILDDEDATLETFAYDPAGNRTTGGGVTAAYTRDNRLAATSAQGVTRSWRYGAGLDWLTETSTVGGETLERLQLEDGLYKRTRLGNLYKEYLDLGHGVHLVREYGMDGNTLTYESIRPVVHLADLLGSTVATFDAQGNTIADRYYTAFGDEHQASGAPTPVPATALALFDDDILRGYTGHHSLSESRLVHMGGRGYDAKLGRFLSPDPAWQMPYSSQSWNRYSYALNSPYLFTDPTGYEVAALFFDGSVGNALDADSMRDMIVDLGASSGLLTSAYEIELFRHYWQGTGEDIALAPSLFGDLVRDGLIDTHGQRPVLLSNGMQGYSVPISFYPNTDAGYAGSVSFDYGFGRATVFLDLDKNPVGFRDNYNFDPGERSLHAEAITRSIGFFGSLYQAEPYMIRFGVQGSELTQ